jgi:hypothetical protein
MGEFSGPDPSFRGVAGDRREVHPLRRPPLGAIIAAIVVGDAPVFCGPGKEEEHPFRSRGHRCPSVRPSVRRHLQKGDEPLRPEWIGNATTAEILKTTEVFVWRLAKATPDLLKAHQDRYPKKQNPRT